MSICFRIARTIGLKSRSHGKDQRKLIVSRKVNIWSLVRELNHLLNLISLLNWNRMFPNELDYIDELALCGSVSVSRNTVSMCHLDYCNYLVFHP